MSDTTVAVLGLGYVGLPLAVEFGKKCKRTVAFDINKTRIEELKKGIDRTEEVDPSDLRETKVEFTYDENDLKGVEYYVLAIPTPVDENHNPVLSLLIEASKTAGRQLEKGAVVINESTVYPGVTEQFCAKAIEEASGLKWGKDFQVAYSPERINPGDKEHSLTNMIKVVSGDNPHTLDRVAKLYELVVKPGVFRAASIRVAEAAKVIENTQRDLNIALMNELSIIFDRIGISTRDVLETASTKWNFLGFKPGLVGGHCIGVDPYYLTALAEQVRYHPEVILAGRRINDNMGRFLAQKVIKMLASQSSGVQKAKLGILGVSFKEDVGDIRNSRVPNLIDELKEFGVNPLVHDPLADANEIKDEYGITLADWDELNGLDCMVLAVTHKFYLERGIEDLVSRLKPQAVLIDVKAKLDRSQIPDGISYWAL